MSLFLPHTPSFWSAMLVSGEERFEQNGCDWSTAMVKTGAVHQILELRLHCPTGQLVTLPIFRPFTAFQFKRAVFSEGRAKRIAHVIGRIDILETGVCIAHIWDTEQGLFPSFRTSFDDFAAWREGVEAPGKLNKEAQGILL